MNADVYSSGKRWLLLGLIILFVVVVRVRLLDVPLERDEGEYAYMGQLLLQGIPPYSAAYNMKFPGTYLMYAGIMALFGQSSRGIHIGFMIVNCATILLLFYLGRKLLNDFAAVIASCAYAVLSVGSSVFGFAAHATHFVVLPAIGGALLLLNALERNKPHVYFLSGTLFGLAFLMKQPGVFFTAFGVAYIVYHYFTSKTGRSAKETISDLTFFILGALSPLLVTFFWLYTAGVFDKFWFWTIQYAANYAAQVPLADAFPIFKENFLYVVDGFTVLWIVSALGLLAALFSAQMKQRRMFYILFILFSFLSVCPGFYFREHYFVTFLPAVSISVGIFFQYLQVKSIAFMKSEHGRFIGPVFFIAAALIGISNERAYLFRDGPMEISRKIYGNNPFPESMEIAKFIEARSGTNDRIAVLGSEPQIYFYSRRRSATGHIYMYGLMEHHDYALSMQKEMISEVEASSPKFVVVIMAPTSWLVQEDSVKYIFGWMPEYLRRNYSLVGVADIISDDRTIYEWYDDAKKYVVQSPNHVFIYERKLDGPYNLQ